MAEAYSWREGSVYLWTGTSTPGHLVAYAENVSVRIVRGWENVRMLGGTYVDRLTGLRTDVSIGSFYTNDIKFAKLFDSATAVHMRLEHSANPGGSAGLYLYSGRIDSFELEGASNEVYKYQMTYHANIWSAYGG